MWIQTVLLCLLQAAFIHCFFVTRPRTRSYQSAIEDPISHSGNGPFPHHQTNVQAMPASLFSHVYQTPSRTRSTENQYSPPDKAQSDWRNRRTMQNQYFPDEAQFDWRNKRNDVLKSSSLGDYATRMAFAAYADMLRGDKENSQGISRGYPG